MKQIKNSLHRISCYHHHAPSRNPRVHLTFPFSSCWEHFLCLWTLRAIKNEQILDDAVHTCFPLKIYSNDSKQSDTLKGSEGRHLIESHETRCTVSSSEKRENLFTHRFRRKRDESTARITFRKLVITQAISVAQRTRTLSVNNSCLCWPKCKHTCLRPLIAFPLQDD